MDLLERIIMSDICMINILEFLPLDILLGKDEEYGLCF